MALNTLKQGIIKKVIGRVVGRSTSDNNISKLLQKYSISPTTWGEKNYNTVFRHTSELFDKGKAEEARNYLKQQRAGIKGTKII